MTMFICFYFNSYDAIVCNHFFMYHREDIYHIVFVCVHFPVAVSSLGTYDYQSVLSRYLKAKCCPACFEIKGSTLDHVFCNFMEPLHLKY